MEIRVFYDANAEWVAATALFRHADAEAIFRYWGAKSRTLYGSRAAFIGNIPAMRGLIDHDVINHTQIAHVYVINMNASAGFDRGLDDFSVPVHNVTRPVENISARTIGTVFTNNESLDRLVSGGRPFLDRCDGRSRYRYGLFSGSCCLSLTSRLRLGKY
jgi:hypothetical protein